jgi:hypothetical protein
MDAIQPHQQQQQDMEQQQQQEEEEEVEQHHAWVLASLCPLKDMEVVVVGSHLTCPAFQHLLHTGEGGGRWGARRNLYHFLVEIHTMARHSDREGGRCWSGKGGLHTGDGREVWGPGERP